MNEADLAPRFLTARKTSLAFTLSFVFQTVIAMGLFLVVVVTTIAMNLLVGVCENAFHPPVYLMLGMRALEFVVYAIGLILVVSMLVSDALEFLQIVWRERPK